MTQNANTAAAPGFAHPAVLPKGDAGKIHFSLLLLEAARKDATDLLREQGTSLAGLTQAEAASRLNTNGPNEVAQEKQHGWPRRLLRTTYNPLVLLLTALAILSALTGDLRAAIVIALMVVLGVALRFVQEARADSAAAKLKAMITVTATVMRDGQPRELPLRELVPGDVLKLAAGDMIPADLRLISSKDLFLMQASLTGESLPVEKSDAPQPADGRSPVELPNLCFLGTSVESGTANAVVVVTGPQTYFGSMAKSIVGHEVVTSFDRGISRFTWLMIKFMAVMVPLVFLINGFTKHDWKVAFFFALAVAVGLTPEMLLVLIMAFGAWLPFSPIASSLGFVALPKLYWPILALTLICYVILTQWVKAWLLRRRWI